MDQDDWFIIAIQLSLDIPFFRVRNDYSAYADANIKRETNIFDISGNLCTDTMILSLYGDGFCLVRLEGYKFIPGICPVPV